MIAKLKSVFMRFCRLLVVYAVIKQFSYDFNTGKPRANRTMTKANYIREKNKRKELELYYLQIMQIKGTVQKKFKLYLLTKKLR